MTKGTASQGKHNKKASHRICRRCGNHSMHRQRKNCVSCGFGRQTTMISHKWRHRKDPMKR